MARSLIHIIEARRWRPASQPSGVSSHRGRCPARPWPLPIRRLTLLALLVGLGVVADGPTAPAAVLFPVGGLVPLRRDGCRCGVCTGGRGSRVTRRPCHRRPRRAGARGGRPIRGSPADPMPLSRGHRGSAGSMELWACICAARRVSRLASRIWEECGVVVCWWLVRGRYFWFVVLVGLFMVLRAVRQVRSRVSSAWMLLGL